MKIVHFGSFTTHRPCGVANVGAMLSGGLQERGVENLIYTPTSVRTGTTSQLTNLPMVHFYCRSKNILRRNKELENLLGDHHREKTIDIAHFYSVFTPENIIAKNAISNLKIPYVWSPQGGLDPQIMRRGKLKKAAYWRFFEKRFMLDAAAIHCLTESEEERIRELGYTGPISIIGNPVEIPKEPRSSPSRRITYLGRGDISHKGLDRLLSLFGCLVTKEPELTLNFYGCMDAKVKLKPHLDALGRDAKKVLFHPAVYDEEKIGVFTESCLYIQASRWEGFGISIAEAMAAGTPVAISRACAISGLLETTGGALILDDFSEKGAEQVAAMLGNSKLSDIQGRNGRKVAIEYFSTEVVSEKMESMYRQVIDRKSRCVL